MSFGLSVLLGFFVQWSSSFPAQAQSPDSGTPTASQAVIIAATARIDDPLALRNTAILTTAGEYTSNDAVIPLAGNLHACLPLLMSGASNATPTATPTRPPIIRPTNAPTATPTNSRTATPTDSYYVDSISGSDANAGTSADKPWRTLAPLDAKPLRPGSVVHFRRGSSWTGGLVIHQSGAEGNPITFTTYGAGNRPIFRNPGGPSDLTQAVMVNASWVVVEGLLERVMHFVP